MNNEKAREELRDRKILAEIEYNQSEDAKKKDNLLRYIQALDIAIESLEQDQETKEKMWAKQLNECEECKILNNEWVDVRDRLPKDRDYYLVCGKEKHEIGFACYNQDLWAWYLSPDDMHYGDYEIIAWKPLPQPYERKE